MVANKSINDIRTSYGAWLNGARRDQTVLDLQARAHEWIGVPEEFGESFYMLRYEQNQKYDPHPDNCRHTDMKLDLPAACVYVLGGGG